jgi:hypothetical protein
MRAANSGKGWRIPTLFTIDATGITTLRYGAAIQYSLVESCKAKWVNSRIYRTFVLSNALNTSITLPTLDESAASTIARVG